MLCNNIYSEKTNLHTWFLQVRGHSILTNTVFNWRYFSKLPNYILESGEINYWLNFKYISVIILFKLKLNSPLADTSSFVKKKKKNQSRIKILNYTGEKLEDLFGKLIRFFFFLFGNIYLFRDRVSFRSFFRLALNSQVIYLLCYCNVYRLALNSLCSV